jgi:hypothetical protein
MNKFKEYLWVPSFFSTDDGTVNHLFAVRTWSDFDVVFFVFVGFIAGGIRALHTFVFLIFLNG